MAGQIGVDPRRHNLHFRIAAAAAAVVTGAPVLVVLRRRRRGNVADGNNGVVGDPLPAAIEAVRRRLEKRVRRRNVSRIGARVRVCSGSRGRRGD